MSGLDVRTNREEKVVPGAFCYACERSHEVKQDEALDWRCVGCGGVVERELVCIPKNGVGGLRDAWARARWRIVPPTVTKRDSDVVDSTESHPAYGMIGVARASGSGYYLVGSDFKHQHFLTVTIRRAEENRSLSRDWWSGREELIEISMTEAQWATFISSPNQGHGVPCTIEHVQGVPMPSIPRPKPKSDEFAGELKDRLAEAIELLNKVGAEMKAGNVKKSIQEDVRRAAARLTDGAPWVAKQFAEHMEEVVETAKVEIHAHMNAVVQRAGIQALTAGPLVLEEKGSAE